MSDGKKLVRAGGTKFKTITPQGRWQILGGKRLGRNFMNVRESRKSAITLRVMQLLHAVSDSALRVSVSGRQVLFRAAKKKWPARRRGFRGSRSRSSGCRRRFRTCPTLELGSTRRSAAAFVAVVQVDTIHLPSCDFQKSSL